MADKGIGVNRCATHGEYYMDAADSECPACQDEDPAGAGEGSEENISHGSVHPDYPPLDWRNEVMQDNTRRSYQDWVASEIEQRLDDEPDYKDPGFQD